MSKAKVIITTGSVESSLSFVTESASQGFQVYSFPMIQIVSAEESACKKEIYSQLFLYDWILFTSRNGVNYFFEELYNLTQTYDIPASCKLACVGKKTANVLHNYSKTADYISPHNNALNFAQELNSLFFESQEDDICILFPTGNLTDNTIAQNMSSHVSVEKIVVYNTIIPQTYNSGIFDLIVSDTYDYIVFTSPSCVSHFVQLFADTLSLNTLRTISIGQSTSRRLEDHAIPHIQAQEYTMDGILALLKSL
ncbi:MAG: uroporphyrinogen-III synthase [Bacteroidales bacterium]|jgi:uroporphyrinogen-III synthase|nr:uroporphyrinogen-III synthase [Bacteroidales bacterium]